jgi:hypothetical protein
VRRNDDPPRFGPGSHSAQPAGREAAGSLRRDASLRLANISRHQLMSRIAALDSNSRRRISVFRRGQTANQWVRPAENLATNLSNYYLHCTSRMSTTPTLPFAVKA